MLVYQDFSDISGWLSKAEGMELYRLALLYATPNPSAPINTIRIYEIGSYLGRSTFCLAAGARDGGNAKIIAIDPHTGSSENKYFLQGRTTIDEFKANLERKNVTDHVIIWQMTSAEAAKKINHPIGLLLVDGAHDIRSVRRDIKDYFDKIEIGGTIAFHDSWHYPGVNIPTIILLLTKPVIALGLYDTLTVVRKFAKITLSQRLHNLAFIFKRTFTGFIGLRRLQIAAAPFDEPLWEWIKNVLYMIREHLCGRIKH